MRTAADGTTPPMAGNPCRSPKHSIEPKRNVKPVGWQENGAASPGSRRFRGPRSRAGPLRHPRHCLVREWARKAPAAHSTRHGLSSSRTTADLLPAEGEIRGADACLRDGASMQTARARRAVCVVRSTGPADGQGRGGLTQPRRGARGAGAGVGAGAGAGARALPPTLTASHAASTALCCVEPLPKRSIAASRVACRASA